MKLPKNKEEWKEKIGIDLFTLILGAIGIWCIYYRLKNPGLTETQLILRFFGLF